MRFILGIIVGCLLTVGVAYLHDVSRPDGPAAVAVAPASSDGPLVNWDVMNRDLQQVSGWMHDQWAWISGQFNKSG